MSSKKYKLISIFDSSNQRDSLKNLAIDKILKVFQPEDMLYLGGTVNANIAYDISKHIKKSDFVVIWNGSEVGCFWVREICNMFDIPYCIIERGLFPQGKNNFIIDKEGICCRSESIKESCFDQNQLKENLETINAHYSERGLRRRTAINKTVFVFQLRFDSTVYHYSDFDSNENMVDHYVSKNNIDPSSVVICPHPRERNITSKYKISTNPTIKECEDAKLAVGISSTTMYEILGLGCPVDVLGGNSSFTHPINREWSDKQFIIPTILQNQFYTTDPNEEVYKKIIQNL